MSDQMMVKKIYKAQRFIWEAVNQKIIPDRYQIHHRDSNKENNSNDNLGLTTRKENMSYYGRQIRGKTHDRTEKTLTVSTSRCLS